MPSEPSQSADSPGAPTAAPARRLHAGGLLAGIVAGFLLAVLLGHQAARYSKPSNFVRFQQWINAQTVFFPPFRMLEHLALARWKPGQTVVIVAGNSIFNGVSQRPDELWSRRLQEMLGPEKYVVVNLAFGGGGPTEGGIVVAESLIRRGIPVIVVDNMGSGTPPNPIGNYYGYYYWEARAQGALLTHPARDAQIDLVLARSTEDNRRKEAELRRAAWLNRFLYFQELWHHVGLHGVFTVWNYKTQADFWRPRDEWPDPELVPRPLAERFGNRLEAEMEITRGFTILLGGKDAQGRWGLTPAAAADLRGQIKAMFPPALRPHLLMVLCQNAPFYRNRLTADERARDDAVWRDCAAIWQQEGIATFINGLDFEDADYNDRTHLTPSGGQKLAARVAREILLLNPASPAP